MKKNSFNHWSLGLLSSLEDPKCRLIKSNDGVVIEDKYPKSKYHFLILPLDDISSIYHVSKSPFIPF